MAVFSGSVYSEMLNMDTHLVVILPEKTDGKPLKSLYLLHGYSDDCTSWQRKTRIEQYAQEKNIAVICPEVAHSFYLNMKFGQKYSDYIRDELVSICEKMFNISKKAQDRYIAGLSMGGYGALRTCLLDPRRYAGCGCFSGAIDLKALVSATEEIPDEWIGILGDNVTIDDDQDDFCLVEKLSNKKVATRFYVSCGKQDFLVNSYKAWVKRTSRLNWDITNESWNGTHEWLFWDKSIKKFIDKVVI